MRLEAFVVVAGKASTSLREVAASGKGDLFVEVGRVVVRKGIGVGNLLELLGGRKVVVVGGTRVVDSRTEAELEEEEEEEGIELVRGRCQGSGLL